MCVILKYYLHARSLHARFFTTCTRSVYTYVLPRGHMLTQPSTHLTIFVATPCSMDHSQIDLLDKSDHKRVDELKAHLELLHEFDRSFVISAKHKLVRQAKSLDLILHIPHMPHIYHIYLTHTTYASHIPHIPHIYHIYQYTSFINTSYTLLTHRNHLRYYTPYR
jgi:hypothetical protein